MSDELAVDALRVRYGGVTALENVTLRVRPGRVLGLIGPNGAGKTSLINAVTGVVRPSAGTIALGSRRLDRLAPHRIARAGVSRTYQNIRLFGALSVAENLRAGAFRLRRPLDEQSSRELLRRAGVEGLELDRRALAVDMAGSVRSGIGAIRSRTSSCSTSRPRA